MANEQKRELTLDELIEAAECCISGKVVDCKRCPLRCVEVDDCVELFVQSVLPILKAKREEERA